MSSNAKSNKRVILFVCSLVLASFPGPARSSLAVQNSHRGCSAHEFRAASDERAGPGNEANLFSRVRARTY